MKIHSLERRSMEYGGIQPDEKYSHNVSEHRCSPIFAYGRTESHFMLCYAEEFTRVFPN